jgi:hypothetical protein
MLSGKYGPYYYAYLTTMLIGRTLKQAKEEIPSYPYARKSDDE